MHVHKATFPLSPTCHKEPLRLLSSLAGHISFRFNPMQNDLSSQPLYHHNSLGTHCASQCTVYKYAGLCLHIPPHVTSWILINRSSAYMQQVVIVAVLIMVVNEICKNIPDNIYNKTLCFPDTPRQRISVPIEAASYQCRYWYVRIGKNHQVQRIPLIEGVPLITSNPHLAMTTSSPTTTGHT